MTPPSDIETLIRAWKADPWLAHATLFRHRHKDASSQAHRDTVARIHSASPKVLMMCFRGFGKSTLAEEALIIKALFKDFGNAIIIGENQPRAIERLESIKYELENNPFIQQVFGDPVGATWAATEIVMSNDVSIKAYGRGQSLRGAKHHDQRPDWCFGDDLEDEESVATPEARRKVMRWFTATLLPALDPKAQIRVAATPLDTESLAMILSKDKGWDTVTIPIEYKNASTGERAASWPTRFPLGWIDDTKDAFLRIGHSKEYLQEYMCMAEDETTKVFNQSMIRYDASLIRTWEPVYAMYDPARTVGAKSARTGKVVWSWVSNRLIVWEATSKFWLPDELISDIFRVDDQYTPIQVGVEQDGLHEFVFQPLRQQQILRGHTIPLRAMKAPKGKLDFIKGLQPFFKAREVVLAGDPEQFTELVQEILAFPTGLKDALNALAYVLRMRPGTPMFDGFTGTNIVDGLPHVRAPYWLAANGDGQGTTGILLQFHEGQMRILADWVKEGDPGTVLDDIVQEAALLANEPAGRLKIVAPRSHFLPYDTVGLRPAAARIPVEVKAGGAETHGREYLRQSLSKLVHGRYALQVSTAARWTLRAFTGGYARTVGADGMPSTEPTQGAYKLLMEGLEAWASNLDATSRGDDSAGNYAYTDKGQRYRSALPR
jgi:hypothetical protein